MIEKKILNKSLLIAKNADYQNTKDKIIISEENIVSKIEIIEKKEPTLIAKVPEKIIQEVDTKILNAELFSVPEQSSSPKIKLFFVAYFKIILNSDISTSKY